tara:strand:+ start:1154 stop:1390 length:237 start_codon:yes stop_codon:yes gene_type:complete
MDKRTIELLERAKSSKTLTQEEKALYIEWQTMTHLSATDAVYKDYLIKRHAELVATGTTSVLISAANKLKEEETDESR